MDSDIDKYRLKDVLCSMFYIPDFISEEEETSILEKIPSNRWVTLTHRRLQAIPARLTASNTLLAGPLPAWLTTPVVTRFDQLGIFTGAPHGVNHCLVNEYLPGQGIMPHEDGSAYHPTVATVSLGGSVVLDVAEKTDSETGQNSEHRKTWRILQEPRSLLVTLDAAYSNTLHGIAEVTQDEDLDAETVANWDLLGNPKSVEENDGRNIRTTRISLTYRDVKKVSAIGTKLFGKTRV